MRPGVYTFTITATTVSETGITQESRSTTVTWELIDPCVNQVVTLPAFATSAYTYTISDTE